MPEPLDRPPSNMPPDAVMRSALGLTIPFGIVWAIGGGIIWQVIVTQFTTSMPPWLLGPEASLAVIALSAIFGAICAVIIRLLAWVAVREKLQRPLRHNVEPRREIKTGQNWEEV